MREILFRGKTKCGMWVYGSLILAGSFCCILESEENVHPMDYPYLDDELGTIDGHAAPVIPETVGQFTGLTDKNGKKIFEGDVVQCDKWEFSKNLMCGYVCFNNGCFDIQDIKSQNRPAIDTCFNIKVVGNIHDNPELLEVE